MTEYKFSETPTEYLFGEEERSKTHNEENRLVVNPPSIACRCEMLYVSCIGFHVKVELVTKGATRVGLRG